MQEINFEDQDNNQATGFVMPSSPADRKAIMDCMEEVSNSKTRIEAERELIKEAINDLSKKYDIPKRLLNRLAKVVHKRNYHEELGVDNDFQHLVEILVNPDNQ